MDENIFTGEDFNFTEGKIILINKPFEWTSFDLVHKIRKLIQRNLSIKKIKVGHAGTLDPLATGLMIICTGRATKKITQFQDLKKEYTATLQLGKTTPSFDLETGTDATFPVAHITRELTEQILQNFVGESLQLPPLFSAKNINGKRAYEYARAGKEAELKSSSIKIEEIELLEYNLPDVVIRVICSKGTYIRALVRDIGLALNSGAHMTKLERTAIGHYRTTDAFTIENLEEKIKNHATNR